MNIVYKKIEDIIPYVNNPRKNDGAAVDKVASSIKNFGFRVPIIIDSEGEIVAGHTRYKASKKLGLAEVPCIVADDMTPQQIKAFRIADNRVSEESSWDWEILEIELQNIGDFDFDDMGFDEGDFPTFDNIPKKDLSDAVQGFYEVVVTCQDEEEQEEIYNRLISEGLTCRILTL